VHDHGTWGVVGVLEGVLEERAFIAEGGTITADHGIRLRRGGMVLLAPGSVSTFVPNPDHIHVTGADAGGARVVSLHLHGRAINCFHTYDVAAGTRRRIDVPHFASR
jgi:predicted metal-dependent enzyme (double-stranded beta helix superfamily)